MTKHNTTPAAAQEEPKQHRPGCDALGGYGHGIGPCSCDTTPQPQAAKPVAIYEGRRLSPEGTREIWGFLTSDYEPPIGAELYTAAPALTEEQLPNPGSPEASAMLDSLLAEYHYPANPKNAARAGYEAARRMLAALRSTQGGSDGN